MRHTNLVGHGHQAGRIKPKWNKLGPGIGRRGYAPANQLASYGIQSGKIYGGYRNILGYIHIPDIANLNNSIKRFIISSYCYSIIG